MTVSGLELIWSDLDWIELAIVNPRGARSKCRNNGFSNPKREKEIADWSKGKFRAPYER